MSASRKRPDTSACSSLSTERSVKARVCWRNCASARSSRASTPPAPRSMNEDARMKSVPFVKATACGNDFLLVEAKEVDGDKVEFTRQICERHHGVVSD